MDWMDQLDEERKVEGTGKVHVVHVNQYTRIPSELEEFVYIGRRMPGHDPSILGNPFKVPKNAPRGATLEAYRKWLIQKMSDRDSEQRAEMKRLAEVAVGGRHVALACWCYPKSSCHGEIVKEYLDRMIEKLEKK